MKKVKISFLALLLSIFSLSTVFTSCQKEKKVVAGNSPSQNIHPITRSSTYDLNNSNNYTTYYSQINAIGLLHNNYLAAAFQHFSNLYDEGQFPEVESNFETEFESHIINYFNEESLDISGYDVQNFLEPPTVSTGAQAILAHLDLLIDSVCEEDITRNQFYTSIVNLTSSSFSLSDNIEKYTVGIAIMVGYRSYNYWDINYSAWEDKFEVAQAKMKPGAQNVVKADVKGAISGGIAGGVGGAAAGGIGAVPGAILGAGFLGCASSLKQGFIEAGAG